MRVKSLPARRRESIPRISALPALGRKMFMRILMVVVLPAPFGPIRAKTASLGTVRVRPFSTDVRRNFFVSSVMRIDRSFSASSFRCWIRSGVCGRFEPAPVRLEGADDIVDFHPQPARFDHQVLKFVVEKTGALGGCGAGWLGDDCAGARTNFEQAFI